MRPTILNPRALILTASFMAAPAAAAAQQDTTVSLTWGAFVDAYYANYFNLRRPGDAPLVTQPVRHNEFNVNLAFVEARFSSDRVRGRLALQFGTSVSANYAGEPSIGTHSGSDIARHIQEAVAGYRLGKNFWIDGGIFLSHIGTESWISRDNWTYTRSMIAEYSPYYEAGIKATWSPSGKFTGTLALLNGWQNISESNANKAVGVRLDYSASPKLYLAYSNFLGNEAPEDQSSRLRLFHDFIVKLMPTDRFGFLASFDIGTQGDDAGDDVSWYGLTAIARLQLSPLVAVAGRFERYSDPDGVFLSTAAGPGIGLNGFSIGLDLGPVSRFLWRTEFRTLRADADAFQKHNGSLTAASPFVVSSFGITL